jgi:tRNA-specific 2-thiouridylase
MSGGVDSSTAALILKESGHRVVGVTMKLVEDMETGPDGQARVCCSHRDIIDARSVSQKLDFEHQVHNFCQLFRKEVIERFVRAYASGRTPNPCVDCNRRLKFGPLMERATLLGCSRLATGHYAKVELDRKSGRWLLKRARDRSKDQSYFLYGLSQAELARTIFPLGGYLKEEVRALAASRGIVNAQKPDSQDICFVRDGRYDRFLENFGPIGKPGYIIDSRGTILGCHLGLHRYTIGQRRGLGLRLPTSLFVLRLDPDGNTVTVGPEAELYSGSALIDDVNLVSLDRLAGPIQVQARIRYKQREFEATAEPAGEGCIRLVFHEPQKAVAPGQAAVLYQGEVVVGGGTIVRANP